MASNILANSSVVQCTACLPAHSPYVAAPSLPTCQPCQCIMLSCAKANVAAAASDRALFQNWTVQHMPANWAAPSPGQPTRQMLP
jgi:hypothetical protein